ncbi:hypothetical protein K503DRAFT_796331 [Rhizopogon vinicolor AM-OR11-026]|uniref:Uncharacterized protein n=1 Tax=Rhizopogon vinicolor AM-OR11-026 TaxID=1314800 RepID=A0A1B7NEX7_9AGAM|nr:hypothetical protein K503DRAFT_796331 [Rhizopogon vinicolor AM-OR11-026]
MDILKERLDAGFRVETYFPSYGRAPSDVENVTKYFRNKFLSDHDQLSTRRRPFYFYQTSVIDTQVTRSVVNAVCEGILQRCLENSRVLLPQEEGARWQSEHAIKPDSVRVACSEVVEF